MDPRSAGELAIWIVAVSTALGVILRSRPVRWLWRKNISEPFSARMKLVVGEVVTEQFESRPWTNGESGRAIAKLQRDVAELHDLIKGAPVQIEQTVHRTTRIEPETPVDQRAPE